MKKKSELIVKIILFFTSIIAVSTIVLITFFIFKTGLPVIQKYGLWNFLLGSTWNPTKEIYGILPMVIGTFYVTFLALVIGIPFGISTAVYLAEMSSEQASKIIRPAIELLAGIPSVIYGLVGMVVLNDIMRNIERNLLGNILPKEYQWGYSVLSGGIILAIMILPTIINISEDALRSVPRKYKEGALALGATHLQTITKVIIPAAKSGIVSAVVLAMGRALGETMALIMVIGNMPAIPKHGLLSIFAPISSLTGVIALEMGYAGPNHRAALFAVGIVLLFFIASLNIFAMFFIRRGGEKV
ncbi:phosphate ABC transporter membrane protein 1, PhoT family [Desulfonispora thiosulfatigenes DSM 11270]|uniref:Phosphate transport system permease protein n=1 Tax=Desulfonispora thiosulfatigenes DSM 11270 TaxID=656914 RepID=A0A1W1VGK0_DESTI|nr:phosphate ABC transporter permease subunit PstC [Desulfonispora thiosulfatigenes]SMB92201.1 phosphate ABC transporter membrane protein 1, PhoT family [Desulfonispora thiosulfatigenes DSM 11270]